MRLAAKNTRLTVENAPDTGSLPARPSESELPTAVLPPGPSIFFSGARLRIYTALALGLPMLLPFRPAWIFWLIPSMIAVHAVAVVAAFLPRNQWFGSVVSRFQTARQEVWLTIDDGPDPADTPKLLDALRRHGARATFFAVGRQIEAYSDLARAVVAQGHELANHSHTHPINWFWCAPPWTVARQIDRANQAILRVTGRAPRWFRAPLGATNVFVHAALRRRGMRALGWSSRGFDGWTRDPDLIVQRILRQLRPGAIILLHEGKRDRQGQALNVVVLERLLRELAARGYACIIPQAHQVDRERA